MSRIFRSLEVGELPHNYHDTDFKVVIGSETLTHQDISSHSLDIRVYNTDFVNEHLSFLTNESEGEIRTFAIIGGENNEIERRIQEIDDELGDVEKEIGARYKLSQIEENCLKKGQKLRDAKKDLDEKLRRHANDEIKHNGIYGIPNYNIAKIRKDIETIDQESIAVLQTSEISEKERLLREEPLSGKTTKISFIPKFKTLYKDSVEILTETIKPSTSIEYLLVDSLLQAWVKTGMDYHRGKEFCGFCGQDLPKDIWKKLDAHFNQQSLDLEKKIKKQIELLEQEIRASRIDLPGNQSFYETIYIEFRNIEEKLEDVLSLYRDENRKLLKELKARQEDIFTPKPQPDLSDFSEKISEYISELNEIIERNNRQTQTLSDDQKIARKELRLNDVLKFTKQIGLNAKKQEILILEEKLNAIKSARTRLNSDIEKLKNERDRLQSRLQDEQKGAAKVNEYLNHFFALDTLSLVAEEDESESKYKFQIMRGNQPAYNMSEGERSLMSFCYFMAKLKDTENKEENLIIYIDDPVSSLDNNHIFFVFSLIESVLTKPEKNPDGSNSYRYKQLFISIHNLDFLKYLKTLSVPKPRKGGSEFFLVEKEGASSSLRLMPKYLKDYQTEFIYLFHQIYKCSDAGASEENHQMFYSLGNNLRKFLEAYLFYKYPYTGENEAKQERLRKFFGDDRVAIVLTNRISNELSHLEAIFDRGMKPVDIPEISRVVNFVLSKIKEKDEEQYNSLLRSIGEFPENEEPL